MQQCDYDSHNFTRPISKIAKLRDSLGAIDTLFGLQKFRCTLGHKNVFYWAVVHTTGIVRSGTGVLFRLAELPLRHRAALAAAASRSFSKFSPRHCVRVPASIDGRHPPVGQIRFIAFLVVGPRPFPLLWLEKRLVHALGQGTRGCRRTEFAVRVVALLLVGRWGSGERWLRRGRGRRRL